MKLGRVFVCAALTAMLVALPAGAQDAAQRDAARALATEGLRALQEGRLEEAVDRLNRAYEIYKVPTVAYLSAQALERSGNQVAALERYRAATRLDDPEGVGSAQRSTQAKARSDAAAAAEALEPRVPRLTIVVAGEDPSGVEVTIDGVEVPAALIGVEQLANPGTRVIVGRSSHAEVVERVELAEGAHESVALRFEAKPVRKRAVRGPEEKAPGKPGDWRRPAGWVGLGVGAAGLATWGVTGLMVLNQNADLADKCPNDICPPESGDDVDRFKTFRAVSGVGFVVGVVGAAVGVPLLATRPKQEAALQVRVRANGSSLSLEGRF